MYACAVSVAMVKLKLPSPLQTKKRAEKRAEMAHAIARSSSVCRIPGQTWLLLAALRNNARLCTCRPAFPRNGHFQALRTQQFSFGSRRLQLLISGSHQQTQAQPAQPGEDGAKVSNHSIMKTHSKILEKAYSKAMAEPHSLLPFCVVHTHTQPRPPSTHRQNAHTWTPEKSIVATALKSRTRTLLMLWPISARTASLKLFPAE